MSRSLKSFAHLLRMLVTGYRPTSNDLVQIGEHVCWNVLFNAESSENSINDYFRDMFFAKGYLEVKDQSRHGVSASGKDAAEIDILLTKDGKEIGIFEGMKLNSINADYRFNLSSCTTI